MSGFLYYLPGRSREELGPIIHEELRKLNLAYAFDSKPMICDVLSAGPDGSTGAILAEDTIVKKIGYYPNEQTWRKIPPPVGWVPTGGTSTQSSAWIGYYTDDPPTPEILMRKNPLPGHWVNLGSQPPMGRASSWLVPVARGQRETDGELVWGCRLPRSLAINDEGNWVPGDVVAQYADLWKIASEWWDCYVRIETNHDETDEVIARYDFDQAPTYAIRALSYNYRLGNIEATILQLLDDRSFYNVLKAVIDVPTIQEFCKKKAIEASETSSTAGGGSG